MSSALDRFHQDQAVKLAVKAGDSDSDEYTGEIDGDYLNHDSPSRATPKKSALAKNEADMTPHSMQNQKIHNATDPTEDAAIANLMGKGYSLEEAQRKVSVDGNLGSSKDDYNNNSSSNNNNNNNNNNIYESDKEHKEALDNNCEEDNKAGFTASRINKSSSGKARSLTRSNSQQQMLDVQQRRAAREKAMAALTGSGLGNKKAASGVPVNTNVNGGGGDADSNSSYSADSTRSWSADEESPTRQKTPPTSTGTGSGSAAEELHDTSAGTTQAEPSTVPAEPVNVPMEPATTATTTAAITTSSAAAVVAGSSRPGSDNIVIVRTDSREEQSQRNSLSSRDRVRMMRDKREKEVAAATHDDDDDDAPGVQLDEESLPPRLRYLQHVRSKTGTAGSDRGSDSVASSQRTPLSTSKQRKSHFSKKQQQKQQEEEEELLHGGSRDEDPPEVQQLMQQGYKRKEAREIYNERLKQVMSGSDDFAEHYSPVGSAASRYLAVATGGSQSGKHNSTSSGKHSKSSSQKHHKDEDNPELQLLIARGYSRADAFEIYLKRKQQATADKDAKAAAAAAAANEDDVAAEADVEGGEGEAADEGTAISSLSNEASKDESLISAQDSLMESDPAAATAILDIMRRGYSKIRAYEIYKQQDVRSRIDMVNEQDKLVEDISGTGHKADDSASLVSSQSEKDRQHVITIIKTGNCSSPAMTPRTARTDASSDDVLNPRLPKTIKHVHSDSETGFSTPRDRQQSLKRFDSQASSMASSSHSITAEPFTLVELHAISELMREGFTAEEAQYAVLQERNATDSPTSAQAGSSRNTFTPQPAPPPPPHHYPPHHADAPNGGYEYSQYQPQYSPQNYPHDYYNARHPPAPAPYSSGPYPPYPPGPPGSRAYHDWYYGHYGGHPHPPTQPYPPQQYPPHAYPTQHPPHHHAALHHHHPHSHSAPILTAAPERDPRTNMLIRSGSIAGDTTSQSGSFYSSSMYQIPVDGHVVHAGRDDRRPGTSDEKAIFVALLVSKQEELYGCNMYDTLTDADEPELVRLKSEGLDADDAILRIFESKGFKTPDVPKVEAIPIEEGPVAEATLVTRESTRGTASEEIAKHRKGKHDKHNSKSDKKDQPKDAKEEAAQEKLHKRRSFASALFGGSTMTVHEEGGKKLRYRDNDVKKLMKMGFSKDQAIQALFQTDHDVQRAANILLGNPGNNAYDDGYY